MLGYIMASRQRVSLKYRTKSNAITAVKLLKFLKSLMSKLFRNGFHPEMEVFPFSHMISLTI